MVDRQVNMMQVIPGADSGLSNKIRISISCRNLADMDVFSKSDPEVHVFLRDSRARNYTLIGKTEMILNNLNPDFTKTFVIDYFFEKEQFIKFEVYDVDGPTSSDFIGSCETTVSRIMAAAR